MQTLDVQYSVGIANGIPVTFLSGGNGTNVDEYIASFLGMHYSKRRELYLTFVITDLNNYLLNDENRPRVVSVSWGWNEGEVSVDFTKYVLQLPS